MTFMRLPWREYGVVDKTQLPEGKRRKSKRSKELKVKLI
jgi:hypothetical protein